MRFWENSGAPVLVWIAEGVPLRDDYLDFIEKHGGFIVEQEKHASILLVNAGNDSSRQTACRWNEIEGKVVLNYTWVDACRERDDMILAKDNWGGHKVMNSTGREESRGSDLTPLTALNTHWDPLSPNTSPGSPHTDFAFNDNDPHIQTSPQPTLPAQHQPSPASPMDIPNAAAWLEANPQAMVYLQQLLATVSLPTSDQQAQPTPTRPSRLHDTRSARVSQSLRTQSTSPPPPSRKPSRKNATDHPKNLNSASNISLQKSAQKKSQIFVRNAERLSFFIHRDIGNRTQTLTMIQENGGTIASSVEDSDLVFLPVAESKLTLCREQIAAAMRKGAPVLKKQWIEDCVRDHKQIEPRPYFHAVSGATPPVDGFWSKGSCKKTAASTQKKPPNPTPVMPDDEEEEDEIDILDREAQDTHLVSNEGKGKARTVGHYSDSDTEEEQEAISTTDPTEDFNGSASDVASPSAEPSQKRKHLALPKLPHLEPVLFRRGGFYAFTPQELEYAVEYCRVRWIMNSSTGEGTLSKALEKLRSLLGIPNEQARWLSGRTSVSHSKDHSEEPVPLREPKRRL
ncbi:hypothetical protein CYLTODRAFT_135357 [Cylindrobasidium torrendii FP15055 ss-10]|uniref:BRCT domain-containing protein n=1 Tax=Cylindrobasidium torrendii FP15055 ss-10 TaxID=1314674 RepID=A0A0D7B051_9AGAR|nr:hypothetical protein CYLTODRAFT_135357 [Cylindrobasidium torrendii FP15055 ss-10]